MAKEWTLTEIRALARKYSGRRSTGQISDEEIDDKINEFYQNEVPGILGVHLFDSFFTFTMAEDDGDYDLDTDITGGEDVHVIGKPFTVKGKEITVYIDPEEFYEKWPTSGDPYDSGDVEDVLIVGRSLVFRPPPASADEVRFLNRRTSPTELSEGDDQPADTRLGKLLAAGAAKLIREEHDQDTTNVVNIIKEQKAIFTREKLQVLQEHGTSKREW